MDGSSLFENLVAELAPTLQGLSILIPWPSLGNRVSDDLLRCESLRCLRIRHGIDHTVLRRILEPRRGKLVELYLGGDFLELDTVDVIAENCGGLRKLRLEYDNSVSSLRSVWQAVGTYVGAAVVAGVDASGGAAHDLG